MIELASKMSQIENVDVNEIWCTFASYFCEWNGRDINSLEDKN